MSRSANEVETLAAKAARGAGAPPAQAAQFGQVALCHLLKDRALDDLDAALTALPGGPILSLPLLLAEVIEAGGQSVVTDDPLLRSYAEALPYHSSFAERIGGIGLTIDLGKPASRVPLRRLDLPAEVAGRWAALAARTFVPESDASRRAGAGAGAGLTDND